MATPSEVKSGLDGISQLIAGSRRSREQAKASLLAARNQLVAIPDQFSDVITTINGYTPTGAFETLSKDEKDKLAAEFVALRTALETELTALGVTFT